MLRFFLAALKTIVRFVLGSPFPRGDPGEDPDLQFSVEDLRFWIDSGPDPGVIYLRLWVTTYVIESCTV